MRNYGARMTEKVALPKILQRGLDLHPDGTALVTLDGQWTWRELDRLSDNVAANLLAAGLAPGDRVATLLPNSAMLFLFYLAMFKSGLVGVPLNYRYTPFEIDHALDVSGARAIVYNAARKDDIAASKMSAGLDLQFVDGADEEADTPRTEVLLADVAATPHPEPAADAPAMIFFTSGSTGPAKGVTHTHETLGWMFASTAQSYLFSPDDCFLAGSSCSHIGGFMTVFACWAEGGIALAPRVGMIDATLEMIRTWKPTAVVMLPAALFSLERDNHATTDDFQSFRLVASGGDKVPDQLEQEFIAKTGLPIDEVYGMTEIGLSHSNPSSGLVKLGSVGRTGPGYISELRDEQGKPVPVGQEGRLFVKFPGTMAYYWNRPDATAEVYGDDGWFDTGDIMRVDEQGYFYFCGRKKQIIVHDGSNIFPQEVEDALLDHDAVELVGVVGIADTVHGENVRAYVELKAGASTVTEKALIAHAAERVGYKAPEDIVFLDKMPLNPTGKIDRVALKRLAATAAGTA